MNKTFTSPDLQGYYGDFGGAFIPEMLFQNVEQLQQSYQLIYNDPAFQKDFHALLKDYVGRPTPLFLAERLSEKYGSVIYLIQNQICKAERD